MLKKELGSPLTPKELARMFGISVQTVRRYYPRWGGIEVAPGTVRFFEHIVKERINADLDQTGQGTAVAGSGYSSGGSERRKCSQTPAKRVILRLSSGKIGCGGHCRRRHLKQTRSCRSGRSLIWRINIWTL